MPGRRPMQQRRVTLKDVAERLGVSTATVSNAYNRPDQLSADLRRRVLSQAHDMGFAGPDPAAAGLRRGRTGALAVLLGDRLSYAFSDPAAAVFLDGLAETVGEAGLALLILPGVGRGGPSPDAVRSAAADAVVAYSLSDDDPAISVVRERGLPLVTVDQPSAPGTLTVKVDDESGARAAAEHLLQLGHRRLAVLAFELAPDDQVGEADLERQSAARFAVTRARLAGYRRAVSEAGLDWRQVRVEECLHNTRDHGEAAATRLLQLGSRPTAILAMSDELALGALDAGHALQIGVPHELSVVGYDDTPAAGSARPALTTVRQPLREKGQRTGRAVLALLEGRRARGTTLPTELVVRDSSGPAPADRDL